MRFEPGFIIPSLIPLLNGLRFFPSGDIWSPISPQSVRPGLIHFVHTCTLNPMKLSISEARKRLPELVRQVRKDAGAKVEITVRDEVVAELRATLPEPEPGAAAKKSLFN